MSQEDYNTSKKSSDERAQDVERHNYTQHTYQEWSYYNPHHDFNPSESQFNQYCSHIYNPGYVAQGECLGPFDPGGIGIGPHYSGGNFQNFSEPFQNQDDVEMASFNTPSEYWTSQSQPLQWSRVESTNPSTANPIVTECSFQSDPNVIYHNLESVTHHQREVYPGNSRTKQTSDHLTQTQIFKKTSQAQSQSTISYPSKQSSSDNYASSSYDNVGTQMSNVPLQSSICQTKSPQHPVEITKSTPHSTHMEACSSEVLVERSPHEMMIRRSAKIKRQDSNDSTVVASTRRSRSRRRPYTKHRSNMTNRRTKMAENALTLSHSPDNNIDDIIEVIHNNEYPETDMSSFAAATRSETNYSTTSSAMLKNDPDYAQKRKAYIKIIEQPQPKALRFRYVCEGRSAGAIPGVSSTAENKTHPTIKIVNFKGPVSVVVSCVTVDPPYRSHPHSLVGRECNKGVCTIEFQNDQMEYEFTNLGIQCIKKKDVGDALRLRESIKVDPFMQGFSHRNQPQDVDFNAVRLCFQVYLRDPNNRKSLFPLKPVVSDAIYDKKATADLIICKLSDCTSSVAGGKEIILLCDKVNKEDIKVRFFEIRDDRLAWESMAEFQPSDVHKQVAISFKTPKYDNLNIENPVNVFLQLYRPSDRTRSEPRPFEYLPLDSVSHVKRKRVLDSACNMKYIYKYVEENSSYDPSTGAVPRPIIHANRPSRTSAENMVKVEPRDPLAMTPPTETVLGGAKMTRATVSPRHTGGGMYHVSSSPSPTQLLPHMSSQPEAPFYLTESPNPIEIHMSPDGEVYQPAHSPYLAVSQGASLIPHFSHLQSPNPAMTQFDNAQVATTQVYTIHQHPGMINQYTNMEVMKTEDVFGMSGMDSDLRIPTGELLPLSQSFNVEMIDKHLSENFSNKMNILEPCSEGMAVNPLDKKDNEDMRVAYSINIPSTSQMDSSSTLSGILENVLGSTRDTLTPTQAYDSRIEELVSTTDSPSLKSLASELRSFNQAAERKS